MYGILPGQKRSENAVEPTTFSLLSAFTVAGAIGGIIHGATIDLGFWPGGWGGKAGSCAFVGKCVRSCMIKIKYVFIPSRFLTLFVYSFMKGCLIYRGCSKILASLTPKSSGATSSV